MESLYIVIPAYNESANIRRTIDEWYPIVEKYHGNGKSRLIIIDDGSKDDTYAIMQECAKGREMFIPLTKPNGGHGPTVTYGYRYAIDHGADYVFQTDSDGQTSPEEFHQFWEKLNQYEVVIGTRTVRGDGKSRKFVENVVCFLLRIIFGVKVKDANAPFRLMKADVLAKYLDRLPANFNLPNIMLTTYFVYFKEKVGFLEITFKPRQGGTNSINIKRIVKIGWKALFDFIRLRKEMEKVK